jgi:ribosomal protein S27AE
MSEPLLPCPFCGPGNSMVSTWFDDANKRWRVGCGRCGVSTGTTPRKENDSEDVARARWNTRNPPLGESGGCLIAHALVVDRPTKEPAPLTLAGGLMAYSTACPGRRHLHIYGDAHALPQPLGFERVVPVLVVPLG